MIFIPAWITNALFFATIYLSGYQHVQLRRPNPITNIQFLVIAFSLVMILVVAFCNRVNPWLSLGFLLVAVSGLGLMIRQHRMLPPMKPFQ